MTAVVAGKIERLATVADLCGYSPADIVWCSDETRAAIADEAGARTVSDREWGLVVDALLEWDA